MIGWAEIVDGEGRAALVNGNRKVVRMDRGKWKAYTRGERNMWTPLRTRPWGPHNSRRDRTFDSAAAAISAFTGKDTDR